MSGRVLFALNGWFAVANLMEPHLVLHIIGFINLACALWIAGELLSERR